MVFIDHAQHLIRMKLVYYGSGNSGKTTNLLYIHDHLPASQRGDLLSLAHPGERALFFECTPQAYAVSQQYTLRFHLTTIPGASLHKAERVRLLTGADGIVFVIDSQRIRLEESLADFRELTTFLAQQKMPKSLHTMPCIFQYNKRDCPNVLRIDTLEDIFNTRSWAAFPAVALHGEGVMDTFMAACATLITHLEKADIN
jgi:mutual gliding-motility protein MglA